MELELEIELKLGLFIGAHVMVDQKRGFVNGRRGIVTNIHSSSSSSDDDADDSDNDMPVIEVMLDAIGPYQAETAEILREKVFETTFADGMGSDSSLSSTHCASATLSLSLHTRHRDRHSSVSQSTSPSPVKQSIRPWCFLRRSLQSPLHQSINDVILFGALPEYPPNGPLYHHNQHILDIAREQLADAELEDDEATLAHLGEN